MFTPNDRSHLRSTLLHQAAQDPRISGTALTGSAAADREDPWSDIDLAFGIADPLALPAVVADWTARLYAEHHALHHLDVPSGPWLYRV
ncbi:MAG: nucleotidyltransferase domain-containing protein, partial [Acidobacteria bacterium]|nr:nucleotidyltransferase domain-containing protein [Acidobacteriota bacterium]